MKYSLIIPVYNRPDEVNELLESLTKQKFTDFEVGIVDDGSTLSWREVVQAYEGKLDVRYYFKPNSGPGQTRNYGAERAKGDYLLILDSDILIPEGYFEAVEHGIEETGALAFGGPDRAHTSFSPIQKAINYSMTSFFTTGGIRGGKKKMDKFYPRSFNMGVKRDIWHWEGSRRCVLERTLTSVSDSSRQGMNVDCLVMPGFSISEGLISASSSNKYTIRALLASISIRSIRNP